MAKTKISQYDATAANNTDIDSINIAEGMAPSNVNNAIRELMAHLKDMDAGTQALTSPQLTSADINGGTLDGVTIGGASAGAGTFTTLTANTSITGTLATAAQTNITSVGSLTSLDVTGTVTADGLTVDGNILGNAGFKVKGYYSNDAGDGYNVNLGVTGNTGYLQSLNGLSLNGLSLDANTLAVRTGSSYSNRLNIASNGDISFFEDTGSTAKLFWSAADESLGIGTSSPTQLLHLNKSTGNVVLSLQRGTGTASIGVDNGGSIAVGSNAGDLVIRPTGTTGVTRFTNSAGAIKMSLLESGNVGIGTSSPATAYKNALQVHGADGGGNIRITNDTTGTGTGNGFEAVVVGIDAYLIQREAAPLIFYTNNSEAMRIDSSGNLGFGGVTSPQAGFGVSGCIDTNGAYFARGQIASHQTNAAVLQYGSNLTELRSYGATAGSGQMRFMVGGGGGSTDTEAMRIDSSGNLLVGTHTFNSNNVGVLAGASGAFFATRDGNTPAQFNRKTLDGDIVGFQKDGTTVGSIGSVSGVVSYILLDTRSSAKGAGLLGSSIDANTGILQPVDKVGALADDAIELGTNSNRFKNLFLSGSVFSGATSGGAKVVAQAIATGTTYSASWPATGGTALYMQVNSSAVGSITTTTSATAYNTSSDYRLKTDAQPMTGATDRLKQLNPVNFEWIADGTRVDGFLAHEAQAVVPEAVTGAKDAMRDEEYEVTPAVLDDDGNVVTEAVMGTRSVPDYQGIDQSKLVPLLVATIKELEARITALENA